MGEEAQTSGFCIFRTQGLISLFNINGAPGEHNPIRCDWTPANGQWYYLTVTRSGSNWALYINGASYCTGSDNVTIPDINADLTIGEDEGLYSNSIIDDVRIYNRALSADEILQAIQRRCGSDRLVEI